MADAEIAHRVSLGRGSPQERGKHEKRARFHIRYYVEEGSMDDPASHSNYPLPLFFGPDPAAGAPAAGWAGPGLASEG